MEGFLADFGQILSQNIWLAFVVALVAGLISSFSPCVLSSIPLIIGYVGGYSGNDKKRAFNYSLVFSIGLAITFTTLGALSVILGRLMSGAGDWWYIVLGILMLAISFQLLGIVNLMPEVCNLPSQRKGILGAFFLGVLGGIFSSPCSTPVLIAILAFVSGQGNIVLGILLLLVYSIGHCTLIMIAGTSIGFVQKLSASQNTQKVGNALKMILGILILVFSFYLFYIGF